MCPLNMIVYGSTRVGTMSSKEVGYHAGTYLVETAYIRIGSFVVGGF